ncbi:MAG TPA: alpha/beta hydrolase [Candidatus Limnocylindrales bacterium]|nr:alpha/beta hydrolase [Candidatus Limnocylindrales bacterium]
MSAEDQSKPEGGDDGFEPGGYVVLVEPGDRIHFLDWGGEARPGVVLVHGLAGTAWAWASVARRLRAARRTVAMDLRGHGLSDAPTSPGAYDLPVLASDVIAVSEGSGATDAERADGLVLAGHGFGAIVAAVAAAELGNRCGRLVLVDGGLEHLPSTTGMDVEEFLRGLDEPPEVLRSMNAYLADRRAWDPASWDTDQERAARAAVVETPAGRLVGATRPHALEACVRSMFDYDPALVLPAIRAPIVAVRQSGAPGPALTPDVDLTIIDLPAPGHNLLRYRPAEVTASILGR